MCFTSSDISILKGLPVEKAANSLDLHVEFGRSVYAVNRYSFRNVALSVYSDLLSRVDT